MTEPWGKTSPETACPEAEKGGCHELPRLVSFDQLHEFSGVGLTMQEQ